MRERKGKIIYVKNTKETTREYGEDAKKENKHTKKI